MKKALAVFIIMFFAVLALWGQNQDKITQTLSWTRSNAPYYDVEIQQMVNDQWQASTTQRTDDIKIEVSLSPGTYRYRIITYNLLGRPAGTSDWLALRVYPAVRPSIQNYAPHMFAIDSMEETFTITFTGQDLNLDAAVVLIKKTNGDKPVEPIESLEIQGNVNGDTLSARFSGKILTGKYDLVITNPGGLSTTVDFTVGFKKKTDITVSAGAAPILPLLGTFFKDGYTQAFYPLSFFGRIAVVPFKNSWGSIGFEFTPSYTDLKTSVDGGTLTGQMLLGTLDAVYQKWFMDYRLALNFKAGGGAAYIMNMQFPYSEKETSLQVAVQGGVSVQWYLWKELFLDAGLAYTQLFSGGGTSAGFAGAMIGVGYRF